MADRTGQQLGNYRLARLLGRGGYAEVYLGEHVYLKTQAAIKVLQTRLAEEEMDSFLTEAQTIARLEHPHIVHVFDFGLEDGTPFLVMSYAPNGTLRQRHPKGTPLLLPTIISYVKQVADALQYAHDQKLIHRDVKPENMLVGRGNEVLLSDFGIAVIAHSTGSQRVESAIGTVDYMAPEQIQGKPRPASDQYAFGVVVYEWLCGVRPFHGSPQEMYGQHLYADPPPLHEKAPTISPEVEAVVMRALAKDPQERFARVRTFAATLEEASLSAQPSVFASPGQPLEPPSQDQWTQTSNTDLPPSQWPQPTIAASQPNSQAQATSTTPPVSQWAQPTVAPPPRSVESQLPAMTPPGQPTIDIPSLPSEQSQSIDSDASPSQASELLFAQRQTAEEEQARKAKEERARKAREEEARKSEEERVRKEEGERVRKARVEQARKAEAERLQNTPPPVKQVSAPVVQPGPTRKISRRAVIIGLVGAGVTAAAAGGGLTWWILTPHPHPLVYSGHYKAVYAMAWSPDGKYIASGGEDKTVQVWDARDGSSVYTYHGHSINQFGEVRTLAWSPDGRRIASGDPEGVQVWDATSGSNVFTYRTDQKDLFSVERVAWSPSGKRIASAGYQTVQVWDAADGGHVFTYRGHIGGGSVLSVYSVAWSPDGRRIASGSYNVQVWDATDGGNVYTYRGHYNSVEYVVAWSPDGKRIASGADDSTAQIWDAADGGHAYTYRGHVDIVNHETVAVFSVAWSPDGKRIASGASDNTAQVWDAANGGHVYTYRGHSSDVTAVAWSPDGRRIASGSWDKTVQVWDAP